MLMSAYEQSLQWQCYYAAVSHAHHVAYNITQLAIYQLRLPITVLPEMNADLLYLIATSSG